MAHAMPPRTPGVVGTPGVFASPAPAPPTPSEQRLMSPDEGLAAALFENRRTASPERREGARKGQDWGQDWASESSSSIWQMHSLLGHANGGAHTTAFAPASSPARHHASRDPAADSRSSAPHHDRAAATHQHRVTTPSSAQRDLASGHSRSPAQRSGAGLSGEMSAHLQMQNRANNAPCASPPTPSEGALHLWASSPAYPYDMTHLPHHSHHSHHVTPSSAYPHAAPHSASYSYGGYGGGYGGSYGGSGYEGSAYMLLPLTPSEILLGGEKQQRESPYPRAAPGGAFQSPPTPSELELVHLLRAMALPLSPEESWGGGGIGSAQPWYHRAPLLPASANMPHRLPPQHQYSNGEWEEHAPAPRRGVQAERSGAGSGGSPPAKRGAHSRPSPAPPPPHDHDPYTAWWRASVDALSSQPSSSRPSSSRPPSFPSSHPAPRATPPSNHTPGLTPSSALASAPPRPTSLFPSPGPTHAFPPTHTQALPPPSGYTASSAWGSGGVEAAWGASGGRRAPPTPSEVHLAAADARIAAVEAPPAVYDGGHRQDPGKAQSASAGGAHALGGLPLPLLGGEGRFEPEEARQSWEFEFEELKASFTFSPAASPPLDTPSPPRAQPNGARRQASWESSKEPGRGGASEDSPPEEAGGERDQVNGSKDAANGSKSSLRAGAREGGDVDSAPWGDISSPLAPPRDAAVMGGGGGAPPGLSHGTRQRSSASVTSIEEV